MIKICKPDEPTAHANIRSKNLARLRSLIKRTAADIHGYESEKINLWKFQYGKCCYCEQKIPYPYNDVEHYRPKSEAIREPGCNKRHGYWWLAYSWDNLFYSCASCNRSSKNSLFPLAVGSTTLEEEFAPPGSEITLLAYPGSNEAVEHLQFEYIDIPNYPESSWWKATPINNSAIGQYTIETIGLNTQDRIEARTNYYKDTLRPLSLKLAEAIQHADTVAQKIYLECFRDLFFANQPFSVFAFSVFTSKFPNGIDQMAAVGIVFSRDMLGCTLDINYGSQC